MIQAMTWALVLTSGAGMSTESPIRIVNTGHELAGQTLSSSNGELVWDRRRCRPLRRHGNADHRRLPGVMSDASARTSSISTSG